MRRILVLGDDELHKLVCDCMARVKEFPWQIQSTNSVGEASHLIETCEFCLFILQKNCGIGIARKIRTMIQYAMTPIIFLQENQEDDLEELVRIPFHVLMSRDCLKTEMRKIAYCIYHNTQNRYLIFRSHCNLIPIRADDIIYVESQLRSLYVHTITRVYEMRYHSLHECEQMVRKEDIVQCHRSILVNLRYIERISLSQCRIWLKHGAGELPLSNRYKKSFLACFVNA